MVGILHSLGKGHIRHVSTCVESPGLLSLWVSRGALGKMACYYAFRSHCFIDYPSSELLCSEGGGRISIFAKIPP